MKILLESSGPLGFEIKKNNDVRKKYCVLIELKNLKKNAKMIMKFDLNSEEWPLEIFESISKLWNDEAIQKTWQLRDSEINHKTIHFHIDDTADYFFNNIDRLSHPNYLPNEDDALHMRVRSIGIKESIFKFEYMKIKMIDVGGQKSERRKWIHCFENVSAILYISSLSEYDQYLREDNKQMRMHESILLFEEICNLQVFQNTSIILFLNKKDLFAEKIKKTDLKVCFPNYDGGHNYANAEAFIRARFIEKNKTKTRTIYVNVTCAIDTENIEIIWDSVRKTLLERIINQNFY